MRISVVSIPVLDQDQALAFYTEKLSFEKKLDIPLGGEHRWLTLVAKEDPEGPQLLLEPAPIHFEPSKVYQKALYDAGIPVTQLDVTDLQKSYEQLLAAGVQFIKQPTDIGSGKIAILDDTCGNYIQLVELE